MDDDQDRGPDGDSESCTQAVQRGVDLEIQLDDGQWTVVKGSEAEPGEGGEPAVSWSIARASITLADRARRPSREQTEGVCSQMMLGWTGPRGARILSPRSSRPCSRSLAPEGYLPSSFVSIFDFVPDGSFCGASALPRRFSVVVVR